MVKLNTGCVQNVVTTERGELGRARLRTDAEDSFFPGTGDTYPHLDVILSRLDLRGNVGSVDDELDQATWHSSWQKKDIVSKGDKAGRGRRLAGGWVQRVWAESKEKGSCKRWR